MNDPYSNWKTLDATDYVQASSWTARRAPEHTCWLVQRGVWHLGHLTPAAKQGSSADLRRFLRDRLKQDIRAKNPRMWGTILSILLPIIVRLLIDWWTER